MANFSIQFPNFIREAEGVASSVVCLINGWPERSTSGLPMSIKSSNNRLRGDGGNGNEVSVRFHYGGGTVVRVEMVSTIFHGGVERWSINRVFARWYESRPHVGRAKEKSSFTWEGDDLVGLSRIWGQHPRAENGFYHGPDQPYVWLGKKEA